jgi:hypothetical protein
MIKAWLAYGPPFNPLYPERPPVTFRAYDGGIFAGHQEIRQEQLNPVKHGRSG